MDTNARLISDLVSVNGNRLTTMEIRFPRIILPEVNTHRILSKSTSSTRAISLAEQIREVVENPFLPSHWTKNSKMMYGLTEVDDIVTTQKVWLKGRDLAVETAKKLSELKLHKQYAAHIISPYAWTVMTVTGTSWQNLFNLRTGSTAHPEFMKLASLMKELLESQTPTTVKNFYPALPYIELDERNLTDSYKVSVARCARRSYGTNKSHTWEEDLELHDRLLIDRHLTPFEHVAWACDNSEMCGNFKGWKQYRKTIVGESGECDTIE